jgi:acetyl esterase/lipase
MGWAGWTLLVLVLLAIALFGAWRWALANNAVAMLEWGDRTLGGTDGVRLAHSGTRYGSDPAQRLDVMVPDKPGPHPVLAFIHGGGWNAGTPEEYRFVGRRFAREGYAVVLVGYRLGSEGTYPRMLEDSAAALAWTEANAARFDGNPQRVMLMGHSAGAYNALMLALERQWLGRAGVSEGFVKGVVALSGPTDFFPWTSDSARNAFGHVGEPPVTQPINHVRSDAPPVLLLTGDADVTVKPRNSRLLAKALNEAGAEAQLVELKDVDHAGTAMKLAVPFDRDRRVLDPVLAFLAAQSRPSAPVQAPGR